MKLALYQGAPLNGDIEMGFACIETQLGAAARAGASMTVFPELFLPGYNRPDLHSSLAQPRCGEWSERLSDIAATAGCGMTIGWAERDGNTTYNAATAFDETGQELGHYRKIQLFGAMEQASFTPGDSYSTFVFNGIKTAILICYDVEFPQHCRALADQGVRLVLVPTANPEGYEHVSRILVPSRASEMALIIVYANFYGTDGDLSFAGHSLIAGPDAQPLVAAGRGEALLVADLGPVSDIAPDILSMQRLDYREGIFQ